MRLSYRSLLLSFLMASAGTVAAQSDVYLQINHLLNDNPFEFSVAQTNNLGEDFNVSRMEYYMSEITLVHDGGMTTELEDTWILVDAGAFTNVYLGSFDITELESISFGIGVQSDFNHLDPSTYPTGHPLAPKSPSMHWGWAAGYRFVAMEGKAASGLTQTFEVHALGDVNYQITSVASAGTWNDGVLYVALDGDYAMALKDVSVAGGLISHGETGASIDVLVNFNQEVFREGAANTTLSVSQLPLSLDMRIAPNPAAQQVWVQVSQSLPSGSMLLLVDIRGREVLRMPATPQMEIDLQSYPAGLYNVCLENDHQIISVQQLYINK